MALIIPPGYAQFTLTFSATNVDSGTVVTTFGMGEALGDDPVSLGDATLIVGQAWQDNLQPFTDGSVTLTEIRADGPTQAYERPYASPGTRSLAQCPPNVAMLIKKTTSARGRRAQGRIFSYGMVEEAEVDERGNQSPSHFAAAQGVWSGFFDDITTNLETNVVILQGDTGVSPPLSPPPVVTAFTVQQLVASQRKRLRR